MSADSGVATVVPGGPRVASPPAPAGGLVGTTVDGKYDVLAQLGKGGMGTVYKARHALLGETVALKVVNEALADRPETRERFLREARATMRFVHPNVIPVRDVGITAEGRLFMTLDYSHGKTLRAVIGGRRLPERRAVAIARQIALAMEAAHASGIVHRDLKPENVLVETSPNGEDVVRVADFGLAKLLDGPITSGATGAAVLGTPHYMAPEQACGEETDARTDIYALGCILYELLTGTPVFHAESTSKVLMKHLTQTPEAPSRRAPGISPRIEAAVLKCLAKERGERFQSAAELLSALDEASGQLRATRSLHVLLAEDNLVNQRMTKKMLERWGHSVVVVADGRRALDALAKESFDLVVMDGQMPDLDGYEATAQLRAREGAGARVPVIALTADDTDEGRAHCTSVGMDAHVAKPIQPDQLFDAIERVTRANRPQSSGPGDELRGFDTRSALERVDGDVGLLREIVELLLEEAPRRCDDMRVALALGDRRALERAAYDLKGAAGNCAASEVEESAARVEALAKDQGKAEITRAIEILEASILALRPALEAVLSRLTA